MDILEKNISGDGRLYEGHSELCIEDLCNILHFKNHDEWHADGRITILGCNCGDRDCGPFKVRLGETAYSVIWEDFHGHTKPMNQLLINLNLRKINIMNKQIISVNC